MKIRVVRLRPPLSPQESWNYNFGWVPDLQCYAAGVITRRWMAYVRTRGHR